MAAAHVGRSESSAIQLWATMLAGRTPSSAEVAAPLAMMKFASTCEPASTTHVSGDRPHANGTIVPSVTAIRALPDRVSGCVSTMLPPLYCRYRIGHPPDVAPRRLSGLTSIHAAGLSRT